MSAKPKGSGNAGTLYYFGLHARAGPMRMMFKHAKVEYTNKMVDFADWPAMKPTMPGGCMPVFQPAGTVMKLGQSMAVLHYLGKDLGYVADTPMGTWCQEFAIECYNDFATGGTLFKAVDEKIETETLE